MKIFITQLLLIFLFFDLYAQDAVLPRKAQGINISSNDGLVVHENLKAGKPLIAQPVTQGEIHICLDCRPPTFRRDVEIVILVDGKIITKQDFNRLDYKTVKSVDVFRGEDLAKITTYCTPPRDIVFITTRAKTVSKIPRITDRTSGEGIPNASIRITFLQENKPAKMILADSMGQFTLDKNLLPQIKTLHITSIGYQEKMIEGYTGGEIKLERRVDTLESVVVVPGILIRCGHSVIDEITIVSHCSLKAKIDTTLTIKQTIVLPHFKAAVVYPSPVTRGNYLQVKFSAEHDTRLSISLLTINGQPISQVGYHANTGNNSLSVPMPQNITAGMYLLIIKNETGRAVLQYRVVVN